MHARNALLLLLLGCLAACGSEPGAVGPQAVFCYRTLADIDCHTRRYAGWDGQLVGVYTRTPPPDGLPMHPMPALP